MTQTHTPGSWTINAKGHLEGGMYAPQFDSKRYLADIKRHRPGSADRVPLGEEQEANARLIAAGPDLLAASKALLLEVHAHLDYEDDPDMQVTYDALEAAIAKAEGTAS